jgi:biofilm protein TabA
MICNLQANKQYKRLMLYQVEDGVYLFYYDTEIDNSCIRDDWFHNLSSALKVTSEGFGINREDWIEIDDPLPFCQDDIIQPVRVKGRDVGSPQKGLWERLEDGKWMDGFPW